MPNIKDEIYKIKSGYFKGYDVLWTNGGQIFTRPGFYLEKSENGEVKDILYLEDAFNRYLQEVLKELPENCRSQFLQNLKDKGFIE